LLLLLAGSATELRVVSIILSAVGIALCAHGGQRLRAGRHQEGPAPEVVPLAPRQLAELEQSAIASLKPLERRLFAGSVRYVSDQSARSGNKISSNIQRSGYVAGFQFFVAQQLIGLATAVAGIGLLGHAVNVVISRSSPFITLANVVLFISAAALIAASFVRAGRAGHLGKQFQASGSPHEELPPPTTPPVPLPRLSAIAIGVFALGVIGIGACLMTARYSAPRATGVFCVILGVPSLTRLCHYCSSAEHPGSSEEKSYSSPSSRLD